MIGAIAALADGMGAALLLARGRAEGFLRLLPAAGAQPDAGLALARRSFWAMAFCLPGFLALHLMEWSEKGRPAGAGLLLAHDLAGYVVGWLGFAVLSYRVAHGLGRGAMWPRTIAAWNWCSIVQYLLLVAGGMPLLMGLPGWISQTTWLVATFWALWLEYFVMRVGLQMSRGQAVGLVALDLALGMSLTELMTAMA